MIIGADTTAAEAALAFNTERRVNFVDCVFLFELMRVSLLRERAREL